MASTSSFAISPSNSLGSNTPVIVATILVLANTEYSYALPPGTGTFFIQVTSGGPIKWAYQTGAPATADSLRIAAYGFYSRESIVNTALYTLFFRGTIPGTIVVVESWKT